MFVFMWSGCTQAVQDASSQEVTTPVASTENEELDRGTVYIYSHFGSDTKWPGWKAIGVLGRGVYPDEYWVTVDLTLVDCKPDPGNQYCARSFSPASGLFKNVVLDVSAEYTELNLEWTPKFHRAPPEHAIQADNPGQFCASWTEWLAAQWNVTEDKVTCYRQYDTKFMPYTP